MGKVIPFRKKEEKKDDESRPIFHYDKNSGMLKGTHLSDEGEEVTFQERAERIKKSLEKINSLMRELKDQQKNITGDKK